MGIFWEYFKNKLRWPLIWSAGPLQTLVKGASQALDQARADISEMRTQSLPDRCDAVYLQRVADGRGMTRWIHESDQVWRARVEKAFWFYMTGGRLSCLQALFDAADVSASIIEPAEASQRWKTAGGAVLDGSWAVNGSESLIQAFAKTGVPLLDWAEFAVILNLAGVAGWDDMARWIVSEFKPARSVPIFIYALWFDLFKALGISFDLSLSKAFAISYPWCTPRLDGTWDLGISLMPRLMDGRLLLDGKWGVGSLWPAIAGTNIFQCNIFCDIAMGKDIELPDAYTTANIGESCLFLDGVWVVGSNPQSAMADVSVYKDFRVDGSWPVSDNSPLTLSNRHMTRLL